MPVIILLRIFQSFFLFFPVCVHAPSIPLLIFLYPVVPIHNIQSRIKSKKSIEDKLIKKEKKPSLTNAKNFLMDIAGARVICYFVNDIYNLVEILKSQTDLIVMKERDYIAGPKPNGYRSYHIILGIPVYCLDGMEYFPVEKIGRAHV